MSKNKFFMYLDLNIYARILHEQFRGGEILLIQIGKSEIVKEKVQVCVCKILKNIRGKDVTGKGHETINTEMLMKEKILVNC